MTQTIFGIDPGTREMGTAVIRGAELLAFGVHTLRNGERPYDVIGQARRVVFDYVRRFNPAIVAIEKPLRLSHTRAALLTTIVEELKGRGKDLGLEVIQLWPADVREQVVGNPRANKLEVATALVERFPELKSKLPKKPARSALGFRPGEKYWLHMFDGLGVAAAVQANYSAVRGPERGEPIVSNGQR